MRISVRFFGPAAEAAGRADLPLDLADGATVADAVASVGLRIPGSWRAAVGTEYADPSRRLRDGDEVSLIPPVGGG